MVDPALFIFSICVYVYGQMGKMADKLSRILQPRVIPPGDLTPPCPTPYWNLFSNFIALDTPNI